MGWACGFYETGLYDCSIPEIVLDSGRLIGVDLWFLSAKIWVF
jgi:hypothetical protein